MNDLGGLIGASVPHESAHLHVAGAASFTDDVPEEAGTLHAALGLADAVHGRITAIDVAAVRAAPGVRDVLVSTGIPGENDCGCVEHDDPILACGDVLHWGQPVFAVAADTREQARAAARLGRLTVEDLPAVVTVDDALAADSWVLPPGDIVRGDVPAALAAAAHRLTGTIRTGGQEHYYLEGHIAYALPRDDGTMHLMVSSQHLSDVQKEVARALGWGYHQVSAECLRLGGGFGGKESQAARFACIAALLARRTGRPVKLRLSRDEDMRITGKRHDMRIDYDVGFDKSGRVAGLSLVLAARCGFSSDLSGAITERALLAADNAYYLDAVSLRSLRARTNTVSNTAFRGFGSPQAIFAAEYVMDEIARYLRLDPLQVRRVNFYGVADGRDVTPFGMRVEGNILDPLVAQLEHECDYQARRAEIDAFNATHASRKRGLALTPVKFGISFTMAVFNQAGALVHVFQDGTIRVAHGGTEMGQGLNTKIRQIAAAQFDVPLGQVRLSPTDTTRVPNTSATAASTGSDLNGQAVAAACAKIRGRLASRVAERVGVPAEAVTFARGRVRAPGFDESFDQVVLDAYGARVQLWDSGFYRTPGLDFDSVSRHGRPFSYFVFGAAASEVEIDTLTGEHVVRRVDILHDVGRSLNPAVDRGQIEGAFLQGLGWLTCEEILFDAAGHLLTDTPATYKVPTASMVPEEFRVRLYDGANVEESIYRSKAVGEPPLILALSVFFAIRDAVAAAVGPGARPALDPPATPEAILRAVTGSSWPRL